MIQSSTTATNTGANGVETGPPTVGRGSQAMNVSNKASGVWAACGSSPLSSRPVNPDDLQSSENSVFGVPRCTKVHKSVPWCTAIHVRPSTILSPLPRANPKTGLKTGQIMPKSVKKCHGTGLGRCWRGVRPAVWRVGWKSPEGWHLCRMAFPTHIELRRSGIFEPE